MTQRSVSVCAGCNLPVAQPDTGRRRKWCSERCRKRTLYSQRCPECGASMNGHAGLGANAPTLCNRCNARQQAPRTIAVLRERWAPHRELIERLWAEGQTCREIGQVLGLKSEFKPGVYRAHGYDLPYRYAVRDGKRVAA